jgi:curved DNA-binding protein CbpA
MSRKDLYGILGIDRNAKQDDVKKAYRAKAKESHPDVNDGVEDGFKDVNMAYRTLSDEEKRKTYDETGYYEDDKSAGPSIEDKAFAYIAHQIATIRSKWGIWLRFINVLDELKEEMKKPLEKCHKDKAEAIEIKEAIEQVAARIKKKGAKKDTTEEEMDKTDKMVQAVLRSTADQDKMIAAADEFIEINKIADTIIEAYSYKPQKMTEEQKEEFEEYKEKQKEGGGLADLLKGLMGGM